MMWVLSDVTYFLLALCPVVTYLRLTLRPDVTIHLFDNLLGYPNIAFGLVVNVWCVDTCILALLVSSLSHVTTDSCCSVGSVHTHLYIYYIYIIHLSAAMLRVPRSHAHSSALQVNLLLYWESRAHTHCCSFICCSVGSTVLICTFICCSIGNAMLTCSFICCSFGSVVLTCTFIICSIGSVHVHIHLLLYWECNAHIHIHLLLYWECRAHMHIHLLLY